ncbi:MAG: hypothetical protein R2716_08475 [Microthrixaceae bacterium]
MADALADSPRIELRYPRDLRPAKRAPLLFDGHRSVLVVDPHGRARTELQRHRLPHDDEPTTGPGWSLDIGLANQSLVADASRLLGGIGFLVRRDRSIWTFVDGLPLLVRRGALDGVPGGAHRVARRSHRRRRGRLAGRARRSSPPPSPGARSSRSWTTPTTWRVWCRSRTATTCATAPTPLR